MYFSDLIYFILADKGAVYFSDKTDTAQFSRNINNKSANKIGDKGISTVLYIEDNPSNLRLIKSIFEMHAYINLLTARNAETGLELANENNIDLILLDINLPGMNGYEALEVLQSNHKTKDIKVLAISAAAGAHDIEKGLLAGFKRYLTKPINVEEFTQVILTELNF